MAMNCRGNCQIDGGEMCEACREEMGMSHTKEPWIDGVDGYAHSDSDGKIHRVVVFEICSGNREDKPRILACVNALAGIKNPAAVKDVIEATRRILKDGCASNIHTLKDALAALAAVGAEVKP